MKRNTDMIFLTWEDLVRLFSENKKKLFKTTILCGIFILCAMLLREPRYQSIGTFRRASNNNMQMQFDLKAFAKTLGIPESESNAVSVMRSKRLMRDVIKNTGLQISQKRSLFSVLLWRMGTNFLSEIGLPPDLDRAFAFHEVVYDDDISKTFYLRFNGRGKFDVLDKKRNIVACGVVGQKIVWDNIQWTLHEIPENIPEDKLLPFQIDPWLETSERLLARIEIKPMPSDNTLLNITYFTYHPEIAMRTVNQVMSSYQNYLREDNDEMIASQLAYLEKRQRELAQKMDQTLKEHVAFLKRSINEKGGSVLFAEGEGEEPQFPHEIEYVGKIMDIENELVRLQNTNVIQEKEWALQNPLDKLHEIDDKIRLCSSFLRDLQDNFPISIEKLMSIDDLRPWLKETQDNSENEIQPTRIIPQLRLFLAHLEKKKEIVKENEQIRQDMNGGLKGLNLESASQLYRDYSHQLDDIYAMIKQMLFVRQQLSDPEFDLSSLSMLLNDPVSREMIERAGKLSMQLQDLDNRSAKEQDRLREGLKTQKRFLAHHIDQIIELHKLRAKVAEEKITAILDVRKDLLRNEKKLLEHKLSEMRDLMSELPEQWLSNKKLKMKEEMGKHMMEGMSQLTESKIINYQVFNLASKPLDLARFSRKPQHPKAFLYSFLAACFGACLLYGFELGKGLFRGLPVTSQSLKAEGLNVIGKLSTNSHLDLESISEADLETLRAAALFFNEKKHSCFQLLMGESADFSKTLTDLLYVQGKKVLIIDCVFRNESEFGLLQYLLGEVEEISIQSKGFYDYIAPGGNTRHGKERLASPLFLQLIDRMRAHYDAVILLSRAAPASIEAQNLFLVADKALLVLKNERMEDIDPYFGNEKAAFSVLA